MQSKTKRSVMRAGLICTVFAVCGYLVGYYRAERASILRQEAANLVLSYNFLLKAESTNIPGLLKSLNARIDDSIMLVAELDARRKASNAWRMISNIGRHREAAGYSNGDERVKVVMESAQ